MLQDFAVGLWFRRLQKRVSKIRFFPYCIQDSPISSFHLQKSRLYALIFWFYPLPCKGHLSIFDLCWGDFTTPPSYYIGRLFQIFNHPPGSVEGKTPFLHPIQELLLSPPPGAGQRSQGAPYSMDRETGNQGTTTPEPHKIFHNPSYKHQQLDTYSVILLSDPQILWQAGGPVSQSKEGRRWRSTLSYGEGPCAFQRQTRPSVQQEFPGEQPHQKQIARHQCPTLAGLSWVCTGWYRVRVVVYCDFLYI